MLYVGHLYCRRGFSDSGGGPPAKQRDLEGAVSRYVGGQDSGSILYFMR